MHNHEFNADVLSSSGASYHGMILSYDQPHDDEYHRYGTDVHPYLCRKPHHDGSVT